MVKSTRHRQEPCRTSSDPMPRVTEPHNRPHRSMTPPTVATTTNHRSP